MMNRKNALARGRGLLAGVALAALAAAGMTPALTTPAAAAEPFNIDVVLSLTGGAAFLGTAEQKALQQAETSFASGPGIGGRPVHFVFHDDQSSPQVAVQLATQIAGEKPPVILGSGVVALCNAMAPLMRRGPVLYCFSPGIYPTDGSFLFSSSIATRDLAAAQLRYFRMSGLKRLAVITSTDASGQDAQRNIKQLLADPENKDIQLVSESTFNPTDVSASAQVERAKGADPQAMIVWSSGASVGTVFKAIRDVGLDIPVATTDANMTFAQMKQYAAFLPKQLYIPSPEWPKTDLREIPPEVKAAKDRFFAAYAGTDTQPDAASSFAWDPALLVVSALQKLGPDATADQIRTTFAALKGFAGVNGLYDFTQVPQRGLDDSNVVVTRWSPTASTWEVVSSPRGVPR